MPCLGIAYDFGLIASVVMPLCPDGNINDYVRDHPHANRLDLVRLHPKLIYCALANLSHIVITSRQRRCLSAFKGRCTWEDLRCESLLAFNVLHIPNCLCRKTSWSHQTVALLSQTPVSHKQSGLRKASSPGLSPPNLSDGRLPRRSARTSAMHTRRAATCGLSP